MSEPTAYFIWMKSLKGPPTPKKYRPELDWVFKDTKKYYMEQSLTKPIPISEEEWQMPLDELAKKYPHP